MPRNGVGILSYSGNDRQASFQSKLILTHL
jgi:hypothetical protein